MNIARGELWPQMTSNDLIKASWTDCTYQISTFVEAHWHRNFPLKDDLYLRKSLNIFYCCHVWEFDSVKQIYKYISLKMLHDFTKSCLLEWPSKSWRKNSIKPHQVQYILRHFYCTTMQKLSNIEELTRPKINVKVIKTRVSGK